MTTFELKADTDSTARGQHDICNQEIYLFTLCCVAVGFFRGSRREDNVSLAGENQAEQIQHTTVVLKHQDQLHDIYLFSGRSSAQKIASL